MGVLWVAYATHKTPKNLLRTETAYNRRTDILTRFNPFIQFIRRIPAWNLILILALAGAFQIGIVQQALRNRQAVIDSAASEFQFATNEILIRVSDRLNAHAEVLYSGAALLSASNEVERVEWQAFVSHLNLDKTLTGIQGVGYSILIPAADLEAHTQAVRQAGFPDYKVWPEGEREVYSSIIYLEPFTGRNLRAFGYDMYSEPVRRAAMDRARDLAEAALSGKVKLVQETSQDVQAGTLMYVPVYRNGMPVDTPAQRQAALLGWVYSPYRMNDLMSGILSGWDAKLGESIQLEIFDGEEITPEALMYNSLAAQTENLSLTEPLVRLEPLEFGGRRWMLRFSHIGQLENTLDFSQPWTILLGGTFINLLLLVLVLTLYSTNYRAGQMAAGLTADLRLSEVKFRSLVTNLADGLAYCQVLYLDGQVDDFLFLEVNPAFTEVSGLQNVVGKKATELFRDLKQSEMEIFDLFAQVAANGEPQRFEIFFRANQSWLAMSVTSPQSGYITAVFSNISERKQAEIQLQASEKKFRALFESSMDGIFLTDSADRVVAANPAACALLGQTEQDLRHTGPMGAADEADPRLRGALEERERTGFFKGELTYLRKDGSRMPVELTSAVYQKPGKTAEANIIFRDITERLRFVQALESSVAEKEALLREVHHRVKNNLAAIIGLIHLQQSSMTDTAVNEEFNDLSSRIFAMSLVHELLYRSDKLNQIDMQPYLDRLVGQLRYSYQVAGGVMVFVSAEQVRMNLDTAIPCGLLITEIVTNALKYAFPGGRPAEGQLTCDVNVTLSWDGEFFTLVVKDNGIGLSPDLDQNNSATLGMRLIRMVGQHQLGAAMQVERSPGACFTF